MANICVFCSSNDNLSKEYIQLAEEVGRLLGSKGHTLVYGGSKRGLMGTIASATRTHGAQNGSRVIGVLPKIFESLADGEDELVATQNLRDRKIEMELRSDAFITLPGGLGTLDEFGDITTTRLLEIHNKPSVLVNLGGFYDPLLAQIKLMYEKGFITHSKRELFKVVSSAKEALEYIEKSLASMKIAS